MSEFSRRIGSRVKATRVTSSGGDGYLPSQAGRPWLLYVIPAFVLIPLLSGILTGNASRTIGSVLALGLLIAGAFVMRQGLQNALDYQKRTFTKAPPPLKLGSAMAIGAGTFVLSYVGNGDSIVMGALYGMIAAGGTVLAYGMDPRADKGVDADLAERAGIKTEDVITTIDEANAKISAIEEGATRLRGRELKDRIGRIASKARVIVGELEKDPSDIRRARRFLVTYLDGARDVVTKYGAQQGPSSSSELTESFRHVLETIETVFEQQEAELKKNDTLDLEVQIDVLKTQLEREGVH